MIVTGQIPTGSRSGCRIWWMVSGWVIRVLTTSAASRAASLRSGSVVWSAKFCRAVSRAAGSSVSRSRVKVAGMACGSRSHTVAVPSLGMGGLGAV